MRRNRSRYTGVSWQDNEISTTGKTAHNLYYVKWRLEVTVVVAAFVLRNLARFNAIDLISFARSG
jgi:hypothetical protein